MPTFFYVTGFPKSGNKWLQWQFIGLQSVGGFHVDPKQGLPLLGSAVLDHALLRDVLRDAGVTMEQFVRRMYNPHGDSPLQVSAETRARLDPILAEFAIEASKPAHAPLDSSIFATLFEAPTAGGTIGEFGAIGVPGMHSHLTQVRELLPTFKIINLQRDPRDVVVSYFYHYVSTLTMPLAEKFIIRHEATGEIAHNPKWKRPFARRVMRSMREFHRHRLPDAGESDGVLRVRYEDLLRDGVGEMKRMLAFLNCREADESIAGVVEANRFEQVTGSDSEQRNSLVRKGQSGDWRNYFDRELLRALGDEFPVIVCELGYESDDAWLADVPRTAPQKFEFSRFRIRRSTTRQFEHLWTNSPELRARFPNPWDLDEADSFFEWLRACDDPEVRAWLELARRLEQLWAVDVVER